MHSYSYAYWMISIFLSFKIKKPRGQSIFTGGLLRMTISICIGLIRAIASAERGPRASTFTQGFSYKQIIGSDTEALSMIVIPLLEKMSANQFAGVLADSELRCQSAAGTTGAAEAAGIFMGGAIMVVEPLLQFTLVVGLVIVRTRISRRLKLPLLMIF